MITFTELGKHGRLGNQLFQYAAIKSISLKTGYELKIPDLSQVIFQNQKCLLTQFNLKCDTLKEEDMHEIKLLFQEKDHTVFYPDVFTVPDNINFYGYFQNYRYFEGFENEIREEFTLIGDLEEKSHDYVKSLKSNNEQIVSIHIRRGDNSDGTNPDYLNYYGENDILSADSKFGKYFFPALEAFDNQRVKFLVFSGGSRRGGKHNQTDMEWCKSNFKGDKFIFCEGNTDLEDFAIMKNCDHHITSHMTSFGYWAAFLNNNKDKIVVAPKNYTIPDDGRVKNGFYPNKWRLI
jgi:hypothetical protein